MDFEQPWSRKERETTEKQEGYAESFFTLQAQFARKIAQLSGMPIKEAFAKGTALPNLAAQGDRGQDLAVLNEIFEQSTQTGIDPKKLFYQRYQQRLAEKTQESGKLFGCFSYEYDPQTRIARPHFANRCPPGVKPFDPDQQSVRRGEILAMIKDIQENHPDVERFQSSSWLNNRDEYTHLWPESLRKNMHPLPGRYHRMDLWGQFLNRDGGLNKAGETFLKQLDHMTTLEEVKRAFPYQVHEGECLIADLYEMYQSK